MPDYPETYLDLESGYDSDHAICVCGHTMLAHRHSAFYGEPISRGPCTQFTINDPTIGNQTGIEPCGCKGFKHMDWITGYVIIPEKM